MRQRLMVLAIVLLVAAGGLTLAWRNTQAATDHPVLSQQSSITPAPGDPADPQSVVRATGLIVPNRSSSLSFDQPGTVVKVLVTEGETVTAGQVLAQEDDTTQQYALKQADYGVQAAQATLNKLLEPVDPTIIANAEAMVKAAEGAYSAKLAAVGPDTVKAYQLQYQQALAGVESANKLRADAGGVYSTSDPNYLKAVAQVGMAQDKADIAKLKLMQVERGVSLESAIANIAYAQSLLEQIKAGPRPVDISDAQAQLAAAKVQRDQAQHLLDKTRLVAPYNGVVTKVSIKEGEVSAAAAMIITDSSSLYADVQVAEVDIAQIHVGQPVQLTLDALSGVTVTGKVQRIDPISLPAVAVITYTVHIELDNPDPAVKVGMTTDATFSAAPVAFNVSSDHTATGR